MTLKYIKYVGLIVLLAGLVACGGNSDSDPGDPPSLPEVQNEEASPDISYFETNQPNSATSTSETANYSDARSFVLNNFSVYQGGQTYSAFLTSASGQNADFEDGQWVWTYSFSYEGQSLELRLTAEETNEGYEWALYMSFDDGQGNSIEDYLAMEGTTAQDGSEGDWTFNALNPETNQEQKALTSSWEIISDTEKNMTVELFNDSGDVIITSMYEENEPDHTLEYILSDADNVTVYWNTNTETGYIIRGGTKKCWDSSFQNVPCS